MNQAPQEKKTDPVYGSLYRVAGAAAIIASFLTMIEIIAFILFQAPSTVSGWFHLFQADPIVGILDFWGLEIPMYLMFALVFLGLYVLLRRGNESGMAIALTLSLLGIAIFFATNNPFSMLSLSHRYAAAATDAQRSALLAAGEAILANTNQRAIGGFNIGLLLVSVAGLIVSLVMLKGNSFRRMTAHIGILAFGLSLADYLRQALTSSLTIALLVIAPGALLLAVWFALVGRKLWQSGHR